MADDDLRKQDYVLTIVGAVLAFGLVSLTGIWETLPSSIGWWLFPALVVAFPVASAWAVTARRPVARGKRVKLAVVSLGICGAVALIGLILVALVFALASSGDNS
jgi:F0F1-type ATP synthase membrane subunit c/vacuolar-type H+-ATPase subunit K